MVRTCRGASEGRWCMGTVWAWASIECRVETARQLPAPAWAAVCARVCCVA